MRIKFCSIFVDDQQKALEFYTNILGFEKKSDIPVGAFRWLTVVVPDAPNEAELVLEPNANPVAKTYQEALFKQGIPITALPTEDIQADYERLKAQGVVFTMNPTKTADVTIAIFSDTCGNLIQIVQV